MGYRDNRGPAPFLQINPRDVVLGSEQRFEDMGTQELSGLNDPNSSFYESLVSALDGISAGGIPGLPSITMENAGTNSALYLAIALTAGTIASLPLQVFRRDANGVGRKITTPETRHLWRHPNPEETPQEFWETAFAHHTLAGDMFIYCERNGLGRVVELYTIHPLRMKVGRDPRTRRKVYILDGDLENPMFTATLNEGEIIHVRNLTWGRKNQGLRGFGLLDLGRAELQLDKSMLQHGLNYIGKGARPQFIITSDADIEDDIAERIVKRWMKANGGLSNAGKPAVIGSGGKVQQVTGTPAEAQTIEVRTAQVKVIARFTGVPTHMLMDSTGQTTWGTGLENIGQGFVTYTLARKITPVQQALMRILPDDEYARWNYGGLLRGNMLQRYQTYQIRRLLGMSSNDELRELEDEPPIAPDELWKYQQPLNSNIAAALPAPGGDAPADPDAPPTDAAVDQAAGEVAALALNGAQIASLLTIIQQVSTKQIAPDVAKMLLKAAFPAFDEQTINEMVDKSAAFEIALTVA